MESIADTRWTPELAEFVWAHAQVGMAFVSRDGTWLKTNPFLCEMLGYAESELVGNDWMAVTDPRDAAPGVAEMAKMLQGATDGYEMPRRYIHKFGHGVPATLYIKPWRLNGQDVLFCLSQVEPWRDAPVHQVKLVPNPDDDMVATVRTLRKHWKVVLCGLALFAGSATVRSLIDIFGAMSP